MFVVEGLGASLVGIIALFYLTDRPEKARWLSVEERDALTRVIAAEEAAKETQAQHSAMSVLKDRRVWAFIGIYFFLQIGTAPLTFYFPSRFAQAASNGQMNLLIGSLLALPWLCSVIATRYFTVLADQTNQHRLVCMGMVIAGTVALAVIGLTGNPWLMLLAACIAVPGLTASQPVFWSLPTRYLGGIGAASGIAFIVSIGNLGAFFAPQIKNWADVAVGNHDAGFYTLAALCGIAVLLLAGARKAAPAERVVTAK